MKNNLLVSLAAVALTGILIGACNVAQTKRPSSTPAPQQSGELIKWRAMDTAFNEARETGKPVFVDVYADWCHWCHVLDSDVYSNPTAAAYIESNFIPLKVNSEDSTAYTVNGSRMTGESFASKFRVTGLPTLLVVSSNLKEVDRVVGYQPAEQLIQSLERIRAEY